MVSIEADVVRLSQVIKKGILEKEFGGKKGLLRGDCAAFKGSSLLCVYGDSTVQYCTVVVWMLRSIGWVWWC